MNRLGLCLALLGSFCVLAFASPSLEDDFVEWMTLHKKTYASPQETIQRLKIYKDNAARVQSLNQKHAPKTRFGLNKFADLTAQEFKATYLGTRAVRDPNAPVAPEFSDKFIRSLPSTFDWRSRGAVTPVKDQGQCGSCWSFSATGNVEGQWFLAGNKLVGLSEQNLVDCDHECIIYDGQNSCDAGCNGGLQPNAYDYIIKTGGIDTEASYAYEGVDDTCRFQKSNIGAKISNWTMISQDEDQMAAYLVQHGPLAIAADAVEWQFYVGGVFYIPCGTELDHGILIVGYDSETNIFGQQTPYWIIKNSWGADWGEDGYIYVERGTGRCGVNLYVSSSIV